MQVIATAGHVDHGKSTVVRALTGMEPDRWAEERRRGMTIDLGFAWTTLPTGETVAFVDVPGHERFVTNMLAGVGPVPAVMFVVAADEGWKAQSEEHLSALDALGVRRGLLVVTKCDVGDPTAVAAEATARLATTTLRAAEVVRVSAQTGDGLDALVAALGRLVAALPTPDRSAPVRLWVDRAFTMHGSGTVVTGTLPAGTVRVGDVLELVPGGRVVKVRALQSLKQAVPHVSGVARVAVNLRGVDRGDVRRGMALVSPGTWQSTSEVDVVVTGGDLPRELVAHLGSAAVPARVRRLGTAAARLRLAGELPLHVGDRMLLRDPARRAVVAAAQVADVVAPPLHGRGAAARLAASLVADPTADDLVRRRGVVGAPALRAAGLPADPVRARRVGDRWVSAERWEEWRRRLHELVATPAPSGGHDLESLCRRLDLPDAELARALVVASDDLRLDAGRVHLAGAPEEEVSAELAALEARLAADPFAAPEALEVAAIGRATLAAAGRRGTLVRLSEGVYVGADACDRALAVLAELPSPFSVSAARQALGASRRVVVPLLEHLDAQRRTRKLTDGTRVLVGRQG